MKTRPGEADTRPLPADLRVDIKTLDGEGPLFYEGTLPVAWLSKALGQTDANVMADGHVALELSHQGGDSYLARGTLAVSFTVPCARCLADAQVQVPSELCVMFVHAPEEDPRKRAPVDESDDEDGEQVDDEDRVSYRGEILDIGNWLTDVVAVAYPMRALCEKGEVCRGLCGSCGVDQNQVAEGKIPPCACAQQIQSQFGADESPWRKAINKLKDT